MDSDFAHSEFKTLYFTIMNIEFRTTYIKMLQKVMDIENQLVHYMPRLRESAGDPMLADALLKYTRDLTFQRNRLRSVLLRHRVPTNVEENQVFTQFLADMTGDMERISETNVRDSFIVSIWEMVRQIRSSKYATLTEWAESLKEYDDRRALTETSEEEENTNPKLLEALREGKFTLEKMREFAAA